MTSSPTPEFSWRAPLAALAFLASVGALVVLTQQVAPPVSVYVGVLVAGSAAVSLLLWQPTNLSARTVVLVAAAAQAIALFGETVYEDDFYRFIWDGWRVLEAGTPYGVPPLDFLDDPTVPPAMQNVLEWVNYPEYPTIYGPVLQVLFAAVSFLFGSDELGLRLLFASATLGLVALTLSRHPPHVAALFAWNPLVVTESTIHLHPDIILSLALFAGLLAGRKHPRIAGFFFALTVGVKVVALAAWPMLLRLAPSALITALVALVLLYGAFALGGQGVGLDSTETFATQWYFNPLAFEPLLLVLGPTWGRLVALGIAGVFVLWLHASAKSFDQVPLAAVFGVILLFAPAVNAWYLMWLLPFALDRRDVWPYVASAALPLSYLTGLNLEIYEIEEFAVHPYAQRVEWALIVGAILFDLIRRRRREGLNSPGRSDRVVPRVSVVIPALNEEASVGGAVRGLIEANPPGLVEVIVADNGSSDRTAERAREAGALVVYEPDRGYGAACLAALAAAHKDSTIILFMDADASDVPEEASSLIQPIVDGDADMVIGSRTLGQVDKGAMSAPQRFGNWLAPFLVRLIWGTRYTDLGPFRAIRKNALDQLCMKDRDFGWTIEMQVRAAKLGQRVVEVPVTYRKRIGVSKISGTLRGVFAAGWKILFVIAREAFGDFDRARRHRDGQIARRATTPANDPA